MKFYTIKHKPSSLFVSDYFFLNGNTRINFYKDQVMGLSEKEIDNILLEILNNEVEVGIEQTDKIIDIRYGDFEKVSFEL